MEREGPLVIMISIAAGIPFSEVKATPLARIPSPNRGTLDVNEAVPRLPTMLGSSVDRTFETWPLAGTVNSAEPRFFPESSRNDTLTVAGWFGLGLVTAMPVEYPGE